MCPWACTHGGQITICIKSVLSFCLVCFGDWTQISRLCNNLVTFWAVLTAQDHAFILRYCISNMVFFFYFGGQVHLSHNKVFIHGHWKFSLDSFLYLSWYRFPKIMHDNRNWKQEFCLGDNPSTTLKEYGDETDTGGKPIWVLVSQCSVPYWDSVLLSLHKMYAENISARNNDTGAFMSPSGIFPAPCTSSLLCAEDPAHASGQTLHWGRLEVSLFAIQFNKRECLPWGQRLSRVATCYKISVP